MHLATGRVRSPVLKREALRVAGEFGPSDLDIREVSKKYGQVQALDRVSLTVRPGEALALLGPSGCGKTTLLQLIGGLQQPDAGDIRLRGASVLDVPPHRRNVGIVFQNYALFPHLIVRENIAYGLKARRLADAEVRARVGEMVELLKLSGLEQRYPGELSGGQQQRVALARALAIQPDLLLLDEALNALDKNLREQMQVELSLLQRRLGVTTVFVTHDQREAFAMADRIAIMYGGRIVQIGTAGEIYRSPGSDFVLEFIGSVNCFAGTVTEVRGDGRTHIEIGGGLSLPADPPPGIAVGQTVRVYVRAEDIKLSTTPTGAHSSSPATVALVTFLGSVRRHVVFLDETQVVVEGLGNQEELKTGEPVFLDIAADRAYVVP